MRQARAALRAAFNDVSRAASYLMEGIPDNVGAGEIYVHMHTESERGGGCVWEEERERKMPVLELCNILCCARCLFFFTILFFSLLLSSIFCCCCPRFSLHCCCWCWCCCRCCCCPCAVSCCRRLLLALVNPSYFVVWCLQLENPGRHPQEARKKTWIIWNYLKTVLGICLKRTQV